MKKIGKLLLVCAVLLHGVAFGQNATLTASCSKTTVGLNEPFRITFTTNTRKGTITPPNFEKFIVVSGPYQSSQTQIINGRMSSQRSIAYEIVAQEEGVFTLPPARMKVSGQELESNRLKITVKAGAKRNSRAERNAKESFNVRILASKKSVYVGEPIVLKFRATLFDPVRDLSIIQAPNFENVLQQQLEFKQESTREVVGNKMATVLDFDKRLILPNKPGTLGGQELKISGQVQVPTGRRDFFNMPLTKFVPQVATANIPAVKIKPLPEGAPEDFQGGVGELKLVREISRKEVSGSESITIKLRVEGAGNFNTLEVPELIQPEGFDVYDPKYNENIRYSERGIRGYKEYEYLLVPQYRGSFIVPEMQWSYFNTRTERYETISIAADTLNVENPALSGVQENSDLEGAVKREVKTIDDDIRYLQDHTFEAEGTSNLYPWTLALLVLAGVLWLWQFAPERRQGQKVNWKKSQLKIVQKAFGAQEEQRYGMMLNALEFALVKKGIHLEQVRLEALENVYDTPTANRILRLIEHCNMAQYAPIAASENVHHLTEFEEVWEQI
ncbi:MAG: BatD family protein [Schleiferiaceae bacterium]